MSDSDSDSSFIGDGFPTGSSLELNNPAAKKRRKEKMMNPFFSQDFSDWLVVLERYIKETVPHSLVLGALGLKAKEAVSILNLVKDSQITDLSLKFNNLKGGMAEMAKILAKTKVENLDVSECNLSLKDLLDLTGTLKDSQVTHLDVSNNKLTVSSGWEKEQVPFADQKKLFSHLVQSHLITFEFDVSNFGDEYNTLNCLFKILSKTSIVNLALCPFVEDFNVLFPLLKFTQITKLNLSNVGMRYSELGELCAALKESKVEQLLLRRNDLSDFAVDILAQGLVRSKIIDLDLSYNKISGSNSLGSCLRNTRIEVLNLSCNHLKHQKMFSPPDFLKDSRLKTLNVDECNLGDDIGQELMKSLKFAPALLKLIISKNQLKAGSITQFANIVKDTSITEVDFSCNDLTHDALGVLGDCLQGSKLQSLILCVNLFKRKFQEDYHLAEVKALSTLLEKTKNSNVTMVDMFANNFKNKDLDVIGASIENCPITHFKIRSNWLYSDGTSNLVPHLKFTAVTHLDVSNNLIGDNGAKILCECLKETKIVSLDISQNDITSEGAKAIAPHLRGTNLVELKLGDNDIENDGLQALAEGIENTFITEVCVRRNPGHRKLVVDRVKYKNRIAAHQLVCSFKELVPQIQSNNFCPAEGPSSVTASLEKHFSFFKTVVDEPASLTVLAQGASLPFTKEQLTAFLLEEFPRQLSFFIASQVEADLPQQIAILKKAEEMRLKPLVEHLLRNRPLYMIDTEQGILHPFAYQLLHKYRQPLYHSGIEPEGKAKIVKYFTEHANMEGSSDVVRLLND